MRCVLLQQHARLLIVTCAGPQAGAFTVLLQEDGAVPHPPRSFLHTNRDHRAHTYIAARHADAPRTLPVLGRSQRSRRTVSACPPPLSASAGQLPRTLPALLSWYHAPPALCCPVLGLGGCRAAELVPLRQRRVAHQQGGALRQRLLVLGAHLQGRIAREGEGRGGGRARSQ